jgi:hypothetical protein
MLMGCTKVPDENIKWTMGANIVNFFSWSDLEGETKNTFARQ